MPKKPKVSIIMPAYNIAKFIEEAIKSVIDQTFKNWELIIVVDPSSDKTVEIVKSLKNRKLKKFFNKKRTRISTARNIGLKNAEGKYICFLDADDIYEPDKLELQVNYLDEHPKVVMIYTDFVIIDKNGKTIKKMIVEEFDKNLIFKKFLIPSGSVMLRKYILDDVGFFDEKLELAEDFDLWLRIADKNYKIVKMNFISYKYRIHSKQISSWYKKKKKRVKKARKILEEKWKEKLKLPPLFSKKNIYEVEKERKNS